MREVLSAGRRGFDAVVVDLPRHRDAVVDETISRCDHVVLVSTLTVPGAVASWCLAHEEYGRLSLARDLAAAVGYARERVTFDLPLAMHRASAS